MTECSNSFFCLQKRRGQGDGRGFAAKVIGTLDNIRDTRPSPFRILLQTVNIIWTPKLGRVARDNCFVRQYSFYDAFSVLLRS